eukprot:2791854-Prymnesium_polylepis.1
MSRIQAGRGLVRYRGATTARNSYLQRQPSCSIDAVAETPPPVKIAGTRNVRQINAHEPVHRKQRSNRALILLQARHAAARGDPLAAWSAGLVFWRWWT